MKTLLCGISSKYIHSTPAVYCLKKASEYYANLYSAKIGDIDIFEASVNDSYDAILYNIVNLTPDCIGFSVYIWNVDLISKLCSDIKKMLPDTVIILGGPEVSFGIDANVFPVGSYDYVICGEGERAFFCLLCELCSKKYNVEFEAPPLFGYVNSGGAVSAARINDLSELPFIYDENNIERFKNRILYYETSRGCPFNCAYCLSGAESKVTFLSLDRVYNEIDFFNRQKVKQVKFVDRTFNCNVKRAKDIVKHIVSLEQCSTNFHFEVGADLFDDELTDLLCNSPQGRIQIEAGIQSVHEDTLCACCRKTDVNKCFENLKKVIESGNVNVHTDLIAGLPFETLELFKISFNKAYALSSHQLQLGFLKLLKGAPLNEMTAVHGYVFSKNSPYEIIKNNYISHCELLKLKELENTFERYYNSGSFAYIVKRLLKFYDTPYDMYRDIADYLALHGYIFKSISMQQSFDLLHGFIIEKIMRISEMEMRELESLMLLDYFSSNKSDLPPESLKHIWTSERMINSKNSDIMKKYTTGEFKNLRLRVIDGEIYIFDFLNNDPVTGRFTWVKTEEKYEVN